MQDWHVATLVGNSPDKGISFWVVAVVIAISFVVGQFLDAIREVILENFVFNRFCGEVRWEFFFEAKRESLENLEEWFYTWYEMDANLVVALVLAGIVGLIRGIPIYWLIWIGIIVVIAIIFFLDAKELRTYTKKMIDRYYQFNQRNS